MQWSKAVTGGIRPPPLCKHTCTLVGSKLYVIGGSYTAFDEAQEAEVEVFNKIMIFDTETMSWDIPETSGTAPGPHRAHAATHVGDGRIFVFGGGDGPNYFNELFILDTVTLDWTNPKVSGQQPGPRRAHTLTVVGQKLYLFGGGDGASALSETFVLDIEKLHWSLLSPKGFVPDPRGYHTGCAVGDKIIYFGGSDTHECFSDMIVLDTSTGTFSKKKLPSSKCRYSHTASIVGPWMFIFGGCDGAEYVDELDLLNIASLEWKKVPVFGEFPSPRGYHTAVFHNSRLFIFGGAAGATIYDDLYILDLGVYGYLPLIPAKLV